MHFCTLKQSTHSRKTRSVPHTSNAPHQRGARSGEQCTNVPAPLAQHSNDLCSKGRRTATPKPAAKALFFFSTVHGALLFLRARRKRRGGCISNKRDVGAFQQKNGIPEREKTPSPKRASLPSAQLRQTRRQHPGQAPLPEGTTSCPHSGANPLGIPSGKGIRPTRALPPNQIITYLPSAAPAAPCRGNSPPLPWAR